MKTQFGVLKGAAHTAADNFRALRYLAKYTINPARAHGIAHEVGSLAIGKLADLVVWKPAFFGVKPELVLKGGFIACANMGDPNASIPTPQPTMYRPQFGSFAKARTQTSLTFVSQASIDNGTIGRLELSKRISAVKNCRTVGKKDMLFNDSMGRIDVDPETYVVRYEGEELTCEPATVLPLAQRYFLF